MEYKVTCTSCKKSGLYDKSEVENIGTFATPIFAVRCHHCDKFIKTESGDSKKKFPKNKDIVLERDLETGGVKIGRRNKKIGLNKKGNAVERADKGDIREYWAQQFFKEHFKDYGFKNVNGPFDVGPDFTTVGGIGIEIERTWRNYIDHGHPTNENFDKVKYLIVLSSAKPRADKLHLLPEKILYIDRDKFVPWFRESCRRFVENKEKERQQQQLTLRIELIKGEFYKRWLFVCPDKDRDMAACPSCQGCAYEPEFDFFEWATEFVFYYDHSIWDEEFSFGQIKPKDLDDFFNKKLGFD